jgi:hypothetical protein
MASDAPENLDVRLNESCPFASTRMYEVAGHVSRLPNRELNVLCELHGFRRLNVCGRVFHGASTGMLAKIAIKNATMRRQ